MKTEMTVKAEALVAPALPEVDPRSVTVNSEGFGWRTLLVRVPAGMTQDDLRSPKVWRKVQGSRSHALVRLDHLFILSHDESWFARAVVTYADNNEAHLMIEKVGTFKEVGKALYSDGTYRVAWNGGSFSSVSWMACRLTALGIRPNRLQSLRSSVSIRRRWADDRAS